MICYRCTLRSDHIYKGYESYEGEHIFLLTCLPLVCEWDENTWFTLLAYFKGTLPHSWQSPHNVWDSPDPIRLITGDFDSLTSVSPFPHLQLLPDNHHPTLYFYDFDLLGYVRFHIWVRCVFPCLFLCVYSCHKRQDFLLYCSWIIFPCIDLVKINRSIVKVLRFYLNKNQFKSDSIKTEVVRSAPQDEARFFQKCFSRKDSEAKWGHYWVSYGFRHCIIWDSLIARDWLSFDFHFLTPRHYRPFPQRAPIPFIREPWRPLISFQYFSFCLFPDCDMIRIIQHVAFWVSCLSFNETALRCLHVALWIGIGSHFITRQDSVVGMHDCSLICRLKGIFCVNTRL